MCIICKINHKVDVYIFRFKKHIDEISTRENITKVDMDFLQLKAKAIVDCYLVSEVLPRVQVRKGTRKFLMSILLWMFRTMSKITTVWIPTFLAFSFNGYKSYLRVLV